MFGRKARQIANQAIMIATARTDSHDLLAKIVEKNKKIIALHEVVAERAKIIKDQAELIRGLNSQITQLTNAALRQEGELRRELEGAREEVGRAQGAADAAIQAGGIIGDQLHAAQAEIVLKDVTIAKLNLDIEDLKGAKGRLMEALRRARVQADGAQLLGVDISAELGLPKKDTPALQALREEIAKVREGDVEVVWEIPGQPVYPGGWCVPTLKMPAQVDGEPLPQRTPGRKLQEQAAEDASPQS